MLFENIVTLSSLVVIVDKNYRKGNADSRAHLEFLPSENEIHVIE